jgi:ketosteroid isomerase-like protein
VASGTDAVMTDRTALLRDFYLAIDEKDWRRATSYLAPDCRWHILANDVTDAASVTGPDGVADWFQSALGGIGTRQVIDQIADRDDAVAVFTTATVTSAGSASRSEWIDVFRFAGDQITEHVSVQTG